jgi:hypothetical protein
MSELTQCNYCSLRQIRKQAKSDGMKVTIRVGWNGGKDIYVHPKEIVIPNVNGDKNPLRDKYCHNWMQSIGSSCSC